jgi:glycerol-3-phosphate dehydrogenase
VMVRLPEAFRGLGFETMTRGGEPFYVIPWDDLHYFGPYNKAHDGSADGFVAAEDEITGLIDEMNYQFPALRLRRQDVIYSWSGVRPRTARRGHPAGGPAVMLHDFDRQGLPGYYVYTGGLLMTHRSAGRAIVQGVARRLAPSGPSRTVPYGARPFPEDHNTPRISPSYPAVSTSDLRFACQHEHVQRLEDLMFRRVRLGWSERMGSDIAHDVAREVREVMGWSPAEADEQADRYITELRQKYQLRA